MVISIEDHWLYTPYISPISSNTQHTYARIACKTKYCGDDSSPDSYQILTSKCHCQTVRTCDTTTTTRTKTQRMFLSVWLWVTMTGWLVRNKASNVKISRISATSPSPSSSSSSYLHSLRFFSFFLFRLTWSHRSLCLCRERNMHNSFITLNLKSLNNLY